MASIYGCRECGTDLNLSTSHLFPPDFYFEAGNKGTLSFSWIDTAKFMFQEEDKIRPFFETVNYWGIQRKRTKIKCSSCGHLVGYVYDDGPPVTNTPGQFGFGPSQAIPRAPRQKSPGVQHLFTNLYTKGFCDISSILNHHSKMKEVRFEKQETGTRIPRPPPLPPHPRFWAPKTAIHSVTNQEIAKFWKQKHIEEEDHFLAAIKAAARIKARNLLEEEYKQFEASLKDDNDDDGGTKNGASAFYISSGDAKNNNEVRVGIKDWWTKSKYAYLNQPALESKDPPKRRTYNNYIPNHFTYNSPQLTFSRSIFVGFSSDLERMYF